MRRKFRCRSTIAAFTIASVVAAVAWPQPAWGQKVFSNSRPVGGNISSGGSFRTGTGTRWGRPANNGISVPSRSPDWTLRPTYGNSRSVTSQYDALPGRSTYRVTPPPVSYGRPLGRRSYSRYYGPVEYGPRYPYFGYPGVIYTTPVFPGYGYGNIGFSGVITPPLVIPYGGITGSFVPALSSYSAVDVTSVVTSPPPIFEPPAIPPAVSVTVDPPADAIVSQKIPADRTPITGEFAAAVLDRGVVTAAADRVQSLRYQSSGDQKFRQQDYAAAAVLYEQSTKQAPLRQAAWMRLAWAQMADGQFDAAASSLKTALTLKVDVPRAWISGPDLYGPNYGRESAAHSDRLWDWLQQRPNSTDRQVLVAGFQLLRGYNGMANELFQEAKGHGLELGIAAAFERLSQELLERSFAPQPPAAAARPAADIGGGNKESAARGKEDGGIVSPLFPATDGLGSPQELSPDEQADIPAAGNSRTLLTVPRN